MSDIQSLTDEIQRLGQSIVWWNKWVVVGMAATAIAASILVIAQIMVNKESKNLSGAQGKLLKVKDANLAKELSDKGLLIARVNERAAQAEARAAEARLELAKFKAPRTLTDEQQELIAEKLKPFSGTVFEVHTYPNDAEPSGLAKNIEDAVVSAGWHLEAVRGTLLGVVSGVTVVVSTQARTNAEQAGAALLNALTSEGIAAKLGHGSLKVNPTVIAIKIAVGKKP